LDSLVNVYDDRPRVIQRPPAVPRPSGCLVMDLPFSPLAASAARTAVSAVLTGLGREDLVDSARLVCSELAANAFRSASPPLVLTLDWTSGPGDVLDVEITLTDGGSGHPQSHRSNADLPDDDAEGGRGLGIVQLLAARWSLDVGAGLSRAWCLLRSTPSPRPTVSAGEDTA
jgi:anti-sigma regulatory factor (Ser/Thr protein kinase)